MKEKVIIALSGGVDSAVSAYLLKLQGYDVEAVFMYNWDDYLNSNIPNTLYSCTQNNDWKIACNVAKQLKIPISRVNFIDEYWNKVFIDFLNKINSGLTPNPDVTCNLFIKFGCLFQYVTEKFSANFLATGHYARIVKEKNGRIWLSKPKDSNKDQTYFLCFINYKVLSKVIFPLSELSKVEVRKIAKEIKLVNFDKKDSTGICFIGERNFSYFLNNYIPEKKGKILKIEENLRLHLVGEHSGIHKFTIGQRKGLNLQNQTKANYVIGKDINKNSLFISKEENKSAHEFIYSNWCVIDNINFLFDSEDSETIDLSQKNVFFVKFRYRQKDVLLQEIIFLNEKKTKAKLILLQKQKYITNGQYAVIYFGDICLGGGIIINSEATENLFLFIRTLNIEDKI